MHDPMVVALDINIPLRKGNRLWLLTVWHVEPDGRDSGTVCKGMSNSRGIDIHKVAWLWRHRKHLEYHWKPVRKVRHWLFDRCEECGFRFLWKQSRHSYMGSPEGRVWHDKCMTLNHVRGELDDLTKYVTFGADSIEALALLGQDDRNALWRAEYRLKYVPPIAEGYVK
jgi:hypothetical protein